MDADALIADLDADQRRAVTTESQLVAVIAGAGSGKTRVLTRRIAYRIATGRPTPATPSCSRSPVRPPASSAVASSDSA